MSVETQNAVCSNTEKLNIPVETSPGWLLSITVVVLLNDLSGLVGVVKTVPALRSLRSFGSK